MKLPFRANRLILDYVYEYWRQTDFLLYLEKGIRVMQRLTIDDIVDCSRSEFQLEAIFPIDKRVAMAIVPNMEGNPVDSRRLHGVSEVVFALAVALASQHFIFRMYGVQRRMPLLLEEGRWIRASGDVAVFWEDGVINAARLRGGFAPNGSEFLALKEIDHRYLGTDV